MWLKRMVALGAMTALAAAAGCAQPTKVERVQPDLIEKSALEGEWYYLPTVIDAPYASAYAFEGLAMGPMESDRQPLVRGVWRVEKDYLYFYRTYEFVEGTDAKGVRADVDVPVRDEDGNPVTYEKTRPDGTTVTATRYVYRSTPVLRFPIENHVDVRRKYNPTTGEESNVVVEDTGERFWWQRDHVRVDFAGISKISGTDGGSVLSKVGVFEGQEAPEDLRFRFDDGGSYMDFVTKAQYRSPQLYFPGFGFVPYCLFNNNYAFPFGRYFECSSEEIQIRQAFEKVPEQNSYMPMPYNDQMLGRFGYYRSARARYDELYGKTFDDAIRYAQRFRIWEEYKDENGDGRPDYEDMTPRPIVYYLSENFPRRHVPGAINTIDQWNEIFVELVQALGHPDYDERMLVLCENNMGAVEDALDGNPDAVLAETDPKYCEDMDEPKRLGDLRYHKLASVNDPTQTPLYGFGPAYGDPVTGEVVKAVSHMYTANIRLGAREAVDLIEYEAGVQNFREAADAEHIKTDVEAKALDASQNDPIAPESLDAARDAARSVMPTAAKKQLKQVGLEKSDVNQGRARMKRLLDGGGAGGGGGGGRALSSLWKNPAMASLAGLPFEDREEVKDPQGVLKQVAHPANLSSRDKLLWNKRQEAERGRKAMCMGKHFDDSFRGLALQYKSDYDEAVCNGLRDKENLIFDFGAFNEPGAKCGDDPGACGPDESCTFIDQGDVSGRYCVQGCSAEALLQQLRDAIRAANQESQFEYWDPNALYAEVKDEKVRNSQRAIREIVEGVRDDVFQRVFNRMWTTVSVHEFGHNVGLRHNFESSTDSLNFFREFWDIKGTTNGDAGNGETAWKPKNLWSGDTDEQSAQRLREFQQTSIMEYGGSFNADYRGVGRYDKAAVFFGYGQLVNVFDEGPDWSQVTPYLRSPADDMPTAYPVAQPEVQSPLQRAFRKIHYTNYPEVFGSVDAMYERSWVDWRNRVLKQDGEMVSCSRHDDHLDDDVCPAQNSYCQPFPTGFYCTDPEQVAVPYRFCDGTYDWTSPTCQTRDEGVDQFEIVHASLEDYRNYWPFRGYKRDDDHFNPVTNYWQSVRRYMLQWRKHFEHWAYNFARYNENDWWEKQYGKPWHLDVNGGLGGTLAVKQIFEEMAGTFGRPSDSFYGWCQQNEKYEPVVQNGKCDYSNVFQVREDMGARPIYPSYQFDGYLYTPERAGTIYDRLAALEMMTFPRMIFVRGADTQSDVRTFRLNFARVWPQRMQNLLAGLVTGEPNTFGWCVIHENGESPAEGGNGTPVDVKPRMWFGSKQNLDTSYDNCTPLDPEPEYNFPTTQYRLPALGATYGMGQMTQNFDETFVDRMRLWLEGGGADVSVAPHLETIKFDTRCSGKTYAAAYDPEEFDPMQEFSPRRVVPPQGSFPQQKHVYWPAARLLGMAKQICEGQGADTTNACDDQFSSCQELIGQIEIVRGLYRQMDFGF